MPSDDRTPASSPPANPQPVLPVLGYADAGIAREGDLVTIGYFTNNTEPAVRVAALEAAGIPAVLQNQNMGGLGWYSGAIPVELQVRRIDLARAEEVIKSATSEDLEPAEEEPPHAAEARAGVVGAPPLVVIARFDTVRAMRDTAVLLESARIAAVLPRLVSRGDHPPGEGKRFILRVAEEDLERAEHVLQQAKEEEDEEGGDNDEPRCPKCGSWRTFPVPTFLRTILYALRMGEKPGRDEMDCLACKYRGPRRDFVRKEPRTK
jgi:hypothetical protein